MQNEIFYVSILAILAMIFGYSLNIDKRTLKLEKKNGAEQEQINKLERRIKELELINKDLLELSLSLPPPTLYYIYIY